MLEEHRSGDTPEAEPPDEIVVDEEAIRAEFVRKKDFSEFETEAITRYHLSQAEEPLPLPALSLQKTKTLRF